MNRLHNSSTSPRGFLIAHADFVFILPKLCKFTLFSVAKNERTNTIHYLHFCETITTQTHLISLQISATFSSKGIIVFVMVKNGAVLLRRRTYKHDFHMNSLRCYTNRTTSRGNVCQELGTILQQFQGILFSWITGHWSRWWHCTCIRTIN